MSEPSPPSFDIAPITIEEEMKRSYLDYAMSVIVARALPDVRDGLKPVHRRILYSVHRSGFSSDKAHHKSSHVVGDVMGKYHPHGDQAIYDAMVRMAQEFSMRLPLLDGQGNFGSLDGDPPAAMRYTEIRMARSAEAMLTDIDRDTVDFQANYDNSTTEPTVLPTEFPNLLANGSGGIAVGMATNIPPHNLGEIIDACFAQVDNPEMTDAEIMQHVLAPDFPTGGIILGLSGVRQAFLTGHGSVTVRGRVHTETNGRDRESLIITEVPYQVNKAAMIERIADAVRAKRIEGISELRDESDRDGVRVVIDLKRDAMAEVVLNQIYRYSPLQTTFGVNMLALHRGRPVMMSLKDMIAAFLEFREEVIGRRTRFLLVKARERAHVLVGLAVAVANLDQVIALIRAAPDPAAARERLTARDWPSTTLHALFALIAEPESDTYRLTEAQARAILDLRLQRLTALGQDELNRELAELGEKITEYLGILGSRPRLLALLKEELRKIRDAFATPRRTQIEEIEAEHEPEDLIQREDMVVTMSHTGYVKRVPLSAYRPQRRGGKGRAGMATRESDFVTQVFVAQTHTPVLFFSNLGRVYKLKVYRLPQASPQSRGKALVNLLPLADGETIHTLMPLPEDESAWADRYVMFATARGNVRRNALSDFGNVMANGKIAMKFEGEDAGDRLIGVLACGENDDVLLNARGGKSVRFQASDVRQFQSRASVGVRGMKLAADDSVISMAILRHVDATPEERRAYLKHATAIRRAGSGEEMTEVSSPADEEDAAEVTLSMDRIADLGAAEQFILTVTANGFGKRTSAYEYRVTNRGGSGIINIDVQKRGDAVVAAFPVEATDQIMLVTDGGTLIRCPVDDVRIAGRGTAGVTLFRPAEGEQVVSAACLGEAGGAQSDDDDGDDGDPDDANGSAEGGEEEDAS